MSYVIARNERGPLPQVYPFNLPVRGDVTLAVSATCRSTAARALGGILVLVDGKVLGEVPMFFDAANQRLALPTQFFPITLTGGPYKIGLQPLTANTVTDTNDLFSAWIID